MNLIRYFQNDEHKTTTDIPFAWLQHPPFLGSALQLPQREGKASGIAPLSELYRTDAALV